MIYKTSEGSWLKCITQTPNSYIERMTVPTGRNSGSDGGIVTVYESLHQTINIVAPQFYKTR